MDNRQANINRFEAEMTKVTRDGVDKLMAFIRKSDMYAAPASTRFHLSVTGGLLQHSLNVLDALRANLTKNDDGTYSYEVAGVPAARVTEENVIIMALLHDICKTYFYTTEIRNRKVNGKWEQYEAFAVDDKIPYGHGEKSVMMIEEYSVPAASFSSASVSKASVCTSACSVSANLSFSASSSSE